MKKKRVLSDLGQMNGFDSVVPEVDKHTSSDHVKDLFSRPDNSPLWDLARFVKLLAEVAEFILSSQKFTGSGGCGSASL